MMLKAESKTKKQFYIEFWICPPLSATNAFAFFLMFDATHWRDSSVMFEMRRRDSVDFFGTEKPGMCPRTHSGKFREDQMRGGVWQWTLFELVKKTSLHIDSWNITDRQTRAYYHVSWLGLMCSPNDTVCVWIQSTCVEK
jgi:hypothetical protein